MVSRRTSEDLARISMRRVAGRPADFDVSVTNAATLSAALLAVLLILGQQPLIPELACGDRDASSCTTTGSCIFPAIPTTHLRRALPLPPSPPRPPLTFAEFPPGLFSLSTSATTIPRSRSRSVAVSPATPEPTTATSTEATREVAVRDAAENFRRDGLP